MPPAVGVWLSEPTRVAPGLAKFSRWSWWQMPVPGPEYTPPNLAATVRQEAVVVRVAEVHLERVVVHVAQGNIGLDPGDAQGFETGASAMVPVASWVRVWSMRRPISLPGVMVPETR